MPTLPWGREGCSDPAEFLREAFGAKSAVDVAGMPEGFDKLVASLELRLVCAVC